MMYMRSAKNAEMFKRASLEGGSIEELAKY